MDAGADLVLTDTNRKRARRWGTVRENYGYTETAHEQELVDDPTDARLDVFPDAGTDAFTVSEQRGVQAVRASRYGNPVSYAPYDRPALAMDGDLGTAWSVGAFTHVDGERLRVDLAHAVTTDHVNVVQDLDPTHGRFITRATLRFDGGHDET